MPDEIEAAVIDPPQSRPDFDQILKDSTAQQEAFYAEAGKLFKNGDSPPDPPAVSKAATTPAASDKNGMADRPVDTPPDQKPATADDVPREFPGSDKKRKAQWDKLHSFRDAAEQRAIASETKLKEMEGKLATVPKANPEADAQLLALQQERDKYAQLLEAVAAERSPRFQQQLQPRIASALELAKQAVGPESAERITQLLSMPDTDYRNTQLDSIISELTPMKAGKLNTAISQMDLLAAERQQMAANGQQLYKQWTQEAQERQRAQKAQVEAETAKTFQQEAEAWKGVSIFTPKENDTAHNAEVTKNIELAKSVFMGGMDNQSLAKASFFAAYGQRAASTIKTISEENQALRSELAALQATKPGPPGPPLGDVTEQQDDGSLSYGDRIARMAAAEGFINNRRG